MKNPNLRAAAIRRLVASMIFLAIPPGAAVLHAADGPPVAVTKDKVNGYEGVFQGGSVFTPDAGGRRGTAGDRAVDFGMGTGPVYVAGGDFLNEAAANDEMSFAVWIKKYDIADSSAFWGVSPSSNEGQRGWQAHVPWSNNNIFFDTAGCCVADTQRINASMDTFPSYTGDVSWWQEWRFFVFTKKAEVKQIWVDGELFLEGYNTAPLPTDFTGLYMGSDAANGNRIHGLIDDFAVFGTALSPQAIGQLFAGTLPTALPASDRIKAYWDFNDFPAEGQFLSVTPAPDAADARPDLIEIVHIDGSTPWTQANVSLQVDGAPVTVTVTKDGTKATVRYTPSPLWPVQSQHTAAFTYPGAGGTPQTFQWTFSVAPFTKDLVQSRVGIFRGGSAFTVAGGGRTGNASDRAVDFGIGTGPVQVPDGAFLNAAAADDQMTFAFWIKNRDVAGNSAFWAVSPSSTSAQRGWQAHLPWSDNTIYFDTAGCCDGATQRISANMDTFPAYTGDVSWWQDWHFMVFSKNGEVKQIWIDGQLFLEGYNTAPLPTDFTELFIGAQTLGTSLVHGLIDDFAVFGTALSEAAIGQLYGGTLPTALPANTQLAAYWDFNDMPADGIFVSISPAPGATDGAPNLIEVVHAEGTPAWDTTKVSLRVDGAPVNATVAQAAGITRVTYVPNPPFTARSHHQATLLYPGADGSEKSRAWEFDVAVYTKDTLHSYVGILQGAAQFTPNAGGRSGQAGDYGMDFGAANAGQAVLINQAGFLNQASANDEMSVVVWQKLHLIADSALFWAISPSSNGGQRGFSVHTPWSNNIMYFDTAGCCDGVTQRISAGIDTFPGYSGDVTWWQSWHHFVFQKYGSTKEIWIDGELFLTGDNTNPLPTDFTIAYLGFDPPDNARLRGVIDDFAVFGTALNQATISQLFGGTSPGTLPASTKPLAFWNFNDVFVASPEIGGITLAGGSITVTWTGGGTLQSADKVAGPWADIGGATTGTYTSVATGAERYFRIRQ